MKLGFCAGLTANDTYKVGMDTFAFLKDCGYDYVELPLSRVSMMPDAAFALLRAALKENELPCLRMNGLFPAGLYACDPENVRKVRDYAFAAFERMRACGASVVVYGAPGARNAALFTDGQTAIDRYCMSLEAMLPAAEAFGVCIAVEPLNAMESNLIHTVAEGAQVVRRMDHPNIGLLADLYHMHLAREDFGVLGESGALLRHIHLARTLKRDLPCPGDEEDYIGFFAALYRGGYDGTVSIEARPSESFEKQAKEALLHLRACDEAAKAAVR